MSGVNGADLSELMDYFAPGRPEADGPNQGLKSAPFTPDLILRWPDFWVRPQPKRDAAGVPPWDRGRR